MPVRVSASAAALLGGIADRALQVLDAIGGEARRRHGFLVAGAGTAAIAALYRAGAGLPTQQFEQRVPGQAGLAQAIGLLVVTVAIAQRGAPQPALQLALCGGIDHLGPVGGAQLCEIGGARDHALRSAARRARISFAAAMSSIALCSATASTRSASFS
jgi:hypothetical protein